MPFTHPAIVLTDDLAPYERLKLHILNLGHTWLAECWRQTKGAATMTMREALADPVISDALDELYACEVVRGFAAHGMADEARAYVAATLERFANPFLDHRIADIAGHHHAKVAKRIAAFVDWVDRSGTTVAMPALRAIAARNGDMT